jgi:iron complex outermembrane receptor protein
MKSRCLSRGLWAAVVVCALILSPLPKASAAVSDTLRLYGAIVDSTTGQPLPAVTVLLPELSRGTVSDGKGAYTIDRLAPGRYTVRYRLLGYKEWQKTIDLNSSTKLNVRLAQEDIDVGQITITAERQNSTDNATRQVTVIGGDQLDERRGQTLGEALKDVSGVTLLQTGPSISKPVIHGLHSQSIRVINAGVAQEGQQWGAEHAPEIDPFAPGRIEVLKGAAGIEYGAGAIGGVISIQPRMLQYGDNIDGNLILNGFSNNMQGAASLLLEGGYGLPDNFGWRLQGSIRQAGDSRTSDYVIGNSGFKEFNGSAAVGYKTEQNTVEAYFSHFGTELGIYRGSHVGNAADLQRAITYGKPPIDYTFTYDIRGPRQEITHDLWSVKASHLFPEAGTLELQYGWQSNHRQEFDARRRYFDTTTDARDIASFDLHLVTYSGDIKFRHVPLGPLNGVVGVSGNRQVNTGNSLTFLIPNYVLYSGGVFVLENWLLGDVLLNAGLRYDYRTMRVYPYQPKDVPDTTLGFHSMTAALGALYPLADGLNIGMNIASAWRPPSINELYSNGVHHGTAQYEIGNQLLQSERSYSVDVNLEYTVDAFHGEITAYANTIRDYIFLLPDPRPTLTLRGLFPTFRYDQANALLRGVDITMDYSFTEFYRLGINAAIVRGDNLDLDQPLYQMPADRVRLINHFHLPPLIGLSDVYAEVTGEFVRTQDRFVPDIDYLDPPPGYALVHLDAGAVLPAFGSHIHISASVRNLLNTAYRDYLSRFRYFIDDPGRNFILRLSIPFGKYEEHQS